MGLPLTQKRHAPYSFPGFVTPVPNFEMRLTGLHYGRVVYRQGVSETHWAFVCSRLEILGGSRTADGHDWGVLIHWKDADLKSRFANLRQSDLHGALASTAARLSGAGFRLSLPELPTFAAFVATAESPPRFIVEIDATAAPARNGWSGELRELAGEVVGGGRIVAVAP